MTKRRYRFGKTYFEQFFRKHILVFQDANGRKGVIWRKRTGQRDAQMWAFPIPQEESK